MLTLLPPHQNYFVTEENMSEHEGMAMKSIMELMDWEEPPGKAHVVALLQCLNRCLTCPSLSSRA